MEIIIKLDHDEVTKVKTSSTKNRERDQLIRTIKYRDDQLHHLRTQQDELLMKLQNKDDEIQDLKLENDRLKQREEIMLQFLKSAKCDGISCSDCLFFNDTYPIGRKCVYNRNNFLEISNKATKILEQMEALG